MESKTLQIEYSKIFINETSDDLYLRSYHHEPLLQISGYQCMISSDLAKFPNIFILFSLTWGLF